MQRREWDQALEQYRALLSFEPANVAVKTKIGIVQLQQGAFDASARTLIEILEKEPGNTRVRSILALVYEEQGNLDGAVQELRAVLEMEPDAREDRLRLGIVYRKLKRFAEPSRSSRRSPNWRRRRPRPTSS